MPWKESSGDFHWMNFGAESIALRIWSVAAEVDQDSSNKINSY